MREGLEMYCRRYRYSRKRDSLYAHLHSCGESCLLLPCTEGKVSGLSSFSFQFILLSLLSSARPRQDYNVFIQSFKLI